MKDANSATVYDGQSVARAQIASSLAAGRWVADNVPNADYPLLTRGNVGEVFPDVVRPYSWSVWGVPYAELGWRQALCDIGAFDMDEFPADECAVLGVFGGYCYLNVTASRIFGVRAPGLTPEAIDQSFFGENADVPPYEPKPTDESEEHTAKLLETIGWVLTVEDIPELQEFRDRAVALRDSRPDFSKMSDADILAHVKKGFPEFWYPTWVRHITATYHALIPAGAVESVCAAVGRPDLASEILSTDKPVASAEPAKALWALSRTARGSAVISAAFDAGVDGVIERLRGSDDADAQGFVAQWDVFIKEYGFRGPNEWEMASRVWEIDPTAPLQALNAQRMAEDDASPDARKAQRDAQRGDAIAAVSKLLEGNDEVLGQFTMAAKSCAVIFAARESTRAACAIIMHEMRMAMYALGQRYVDKGIFAQPNDFSMLTVDEWDAGVADPSTIKPILDQRNKDAARLASLVPPFIVNKTVPDTASWTSRDATVPALAPGDNIKGLGGCAGVHTGRARVILDASEPGDLEPGDILVTLHTDPSWTPIFSAVSGVVVEVGAAVSHAVIVSRELGVPCVVSAADATKRIKDGDMITVDGAAGTVTMA